MSFSTATFTRETGNRRRSAAIWAIAVLQPWPISIRAMFTTTEPSEFILTTEALAVNDGIAGALCRVANPLPIFLPVRVSCSASSGVSRP